MKSQNILKRYKIGLISWNKELKGKKEKKKREEGEITNLIFFSIDISTKLIFIHIKET